MQKVKIFFAVSPKVITFAAKTHVPSIMIVANPIYDSVFKFLMDDKRVARTILGALLQKTITHVELRAHEYPNTSKRQLSMFRVDFAAHVLEADGCEHVTLIELQKTWVPTETLRFRQYLGVQYENPRNIVEKSADGHALPMVCVYLLGHNVGDIEEPVLYVHHKAFDYKGQPVTKGLPDAFVDSLTHDSIIVQIPRLHGRINDRLYEVLSIFDQTRTTKESAHMLDIDEDFYPEDDMEMQHIMHRLLMAAADPEMRMNMNVEDEYFSLIDKQETDLLVKDKEIKKLSDQLEQQKSELEQQTVVLKKSIQALANIGMSAEAISSALSIDLQTVQQYL